MLLSVDVEGYWEITQEADPEDSWDRPNKAFVFEGFNYSVVTDNNYAEFNVNAESGDDLWLVYCSRNTGDTFGHDASLITPMYVATTEDEARELRSVLENATGFHVVWNGQDIYVPYNGYFESLNYVAIERFVAP